MSRASAYVVEAPAEAARSHRPSVAARLAALARPATLFVLLAVGVAVAHFVILLSDYKNIFVHPDFYDTNMHFVLRNGLAIGLHDFIDILQQRDENEFRPRWLMFYLETLDHKLRMQLYRVDARSTRPLGR